MIFKNMFNTGSTYIPRLLAGGELDDEETGLVLSDKIETYYIRQPMEDNVFNNQSDKPTTPIIAAPSSLTTNDIKNYFFVKTAYVEDIEFKNTYDAENESVVDDLIAMPDIAEAGVKFQAVKVKEIDGTKWFADYFNIAFDSSNSKSTSLTYIDYLQKNLLLNFQDPVEFYTVKVSPVRILKCEYKGNKIYELVGSHKFNELATKLFSKESTNKSRINNFRFNNFGINDCKIVGYIFEIFKINDYGISLPISDDEMKRSVLGSIGVSEEQFVGHMKNDLSLNTGDIGLGKYIYLMREHHSISLGRIYRSMNGKEMIDVRSFEAYCGTVQSYYQNLLQIPSIQVMCTQEYFRNYMSSLNYMSMLIGSKGSKEIAGIIVDRVGIYLPRMRDFNSRWYSRPMEIERRIMQNPDDKSSIVLNEELIINYLVGGFVPIFAVDFKGHKKDPYQYHKLSILKHLNAFKNGNNTLDLDSNAIKSKLFAYSKEMVIPPKYGDGKNLYLKYNPNNSVDKYCVAKPENNCKDIDLLSITDLLSISYPRSKNKDDISDRLVVCNISFNGFVANEIRSMDNPRWYESNSIDPLPKVVINLIRRETKAAE